MADDNIEHDVSDAACKLGIIMQSSYYFMENILRNMSGENVRRLQRVCKNFYLFCEKFRYDNCETLVIWRKRKDTYDWSWSDCDVEGVKDFLKEYSAIPRFIFLFSETTDLSNDLNSILHSSSSFFCGLTENKFKYRNLCRRGRAYFNALKAGINGFILPYGLLNRMDVCIRTKAFTVNEFNKEIKSNRMDKERFCKIFNWPNEKKFKCLMIFVGQYIAVEELGCFYQSVKSFSEGDQIVIVGGRLQSFVGSSYTANDEDFGIINRRRCQIYVAAFGGEDVVASSLVVYEGIQQSCDIKLNMNHWKAACIDKWPSDISKIGIFFRCVARCNDFLRNNPTLENSIFLYFLPKAFISLYLTMNFNVDFEAIGNAFVQHYYRTFDNPDPNARTAGLSDLYDPLNSYMTFEGVQVKGRQAILEKFASLPFRSIKRAITKTDCQPFPDGSVIIAVMGQLQTDEDPVQSYNQFFVLRPTTGSFFISNEIFRLVLHDN